MILPAVVGLNTVAAAAAVVVAVVVGILVGQNSTPPDANSFGKVDLSAEVLK